MTNLLGIDLGTSSVKAVLINDRTDIVGIGSQEYPIDVPEPGFAEQGPDSWWQATITAVRAACAQAGSADIGGIGFSGQMHGGALLDRDGNPLGKAIIWADQRSASELGDIEAILQRAQLSNVPGTAIAAGFFAATLRWLARHDPQRLDRTHRILLPKDYVRYRMTGVISTEATDAASTGVFDVAHRRWSPDLMQALGLPESIFPPCHDSADVVGRLTADAGSVLELSPGIPVVAGMSDQPAQAIGNGLINPGLGSITIGTGGQCFAPVDAPRIDPRLRLHTFCHAPADRWYVLGAMLSAGLSLRWLRNLHGMANDPHAYEKLSALAANVPPGASGLLFLPYLVGERSPLMDPRARASFIGLTLGHELGHLARAVMEGVAFAMRQILETMAEIDAYSDQLIASGGGLAAPLWRQIAADIIGRPLLLASGKERAGVGAALVAGIGTGRYGSYAECVQAARQAYTPTEPDPARHRLYSEQYAEFTAAYPPISDLLHRLGARPIARQV